MTADPTDIRLVRADDGPDRDASDLLRAHRPPARPASEKRPRQRDRAALADAGYLSRQNLTCPGPDRLIATGRRRDLEQAARDTGRP